MLQKAYEYLKKVKGPKGSEKGVNRERENKG